MKIANCRASGRQLGHVRTSLEKKKWSARFKFNRQREFKTIDCPVRASRTEAEADRSFVAVAVGQVCRSSRMDAAKHWIQFLRDGGVPSSASTAPEMDPALINTMKKGQLRESASKTHGMIRNKKTSKGKCLGSRIGFAFKKGDNEMVGYYSDRPPTPVKPIIRIYINSLFDSISMLHYLPPQATDVQPQGPTPSTRRDSRKRNPDGTRVKPQSRKQLAIANLPTQIDDAIAKAAPLAHLSEQSWRKQGLWSILTASANSWDTASTAVLAHAPGDAVLTCC